MTHICVSELTTIGPDNGLSPGRRQANIWNNAGILLIGPLGTNFIEILIRIQTFSFKKCTWRCRLRNGVHFDSASMCYSPILTNYPTQGPQGHRMKIVTLKEDIVLPHIMRGNRFPSAFRIMRDLIKRTGRHAFVLAVQRSLYIVAVGYHRNPDRYLRLTPDHCWNHQHWCHLIFVNESRVSLYRSDCRAHKYQAVHQHVDQLGHDHYSCRGWTWTPQQISDETNNDGSRLGAYVKTCGGGEGDQESIAGISLDLQTSRYSAPTKRPSTLRTKTWRPVRLISCTMYCCRCAKCYTVIFRCVIMRFYCTSTYWPLHDIHLRE